MRLIDADVLKEKLKPCEADVCEFSCEGCHFRVVTAEEIDNAQTVEPERPKGEWVGNAFNEHHCNKCGHPALREEEPDDYYEVQSRFCPNCGADMRGKEE